MESRKRGPRVEGRTPIYCISAWTGQIAVADRPKKISTPWRKWSVLLCFTDSRAIDGVVRLSRATSLRFRWVSAGLSLKRHTRAPRPPSFPKRPCLMFLRPPKNLLRHPTAFYLVLKIRFKLLPPIQLSGCFGLEVKSWTCGTF